MSKSVGLVIATPKNELSDQLAAIYRVSDALWSGLCPDDTLDGVRDWVEDWDLEDDLRTLAIDLDGLDEQAPYEELHQAVVHFIAKSRLIHLWQCYVAMLSYTDRDANCLQFDLEKIVGNTIHLLYDACQAALGSGVLHGLARVDDETMNIVQQLQEAVKATDAILEDTPSEQGG